MNDFVFSYPVKTYFGAGAAAKALRAELGRYGKTVMLAYGGGSIKRNGVYDEVKALLAEAGKRVVEFSGIMPNPTYAKVQEGAALARSENVDLILAVGGGSVSDCCKIVSAQACCDEDVWEMEYTKHQLPQKFIPLGVIVTVGGTGSEQNNGAVITHEAKKLKSGVWGAIADFAVLDPAYTMSAPLRQVVSGAFDTLSHCMETYFGTPHDDNLSDEIAEAVMRATIRAARALVKDPDDLRARGELLWAAAMGENGVLKIGKVTDFQAHQIEHQLGAYTNCNHGMGLAVSHPVLYRRLCKAAPARFARFARNVWGVNDADDQAAAEAGIDALASFIREIGLPSSFSEMGITDTSCFRAVADSTNISKGCCKQLTADEIYDILMECR
ncbi:MAG: iron-containing alcohol dehydrogenase [Pyramidobacter sp.]|nr:iron-containing alcohol dehydrogenase [Pyramidobacter sp.]